MNFNVVVGLNCIEGLWVFVFNLRWVNLGSGCVFVGLSFSFSSYIYIGDGGMGDKEKREVCFVFGLAWGDAGVCFEVVWY